MNKSTFSQIGAWSYYLGLLAAYTAVGWILAAYAAPVLMWMWTAGLIVYIAWAGPGAIAVAMFWVVSVVWIAAYASAMPLFMYWKGAPWAISLIGVWIITIGIVLMLAFARQALRSLKWSSTRTFYQLITITWTGLYMGWFLYFELLPNNPVSPSL